MHTLRILLLAAALSAPAFAAGPSQGKDHTTKVYTPGMILGEYRANPIAARKLHTGKLRMVRVAVQAIGENGKRGVLLCDDPQHEPFSTGYFTVEFEDADALVNVKRDTILLLEVGILGAAGGGRDKLLGMRGRVLGVEGPWTGPPPLQLSDPLRDGKAKLPNFKF
jgi:hypothetical protein